MQTASDRLPVIAVTGMAFEARIAAGPGVVALCGGDAEMLAADLAAAIARGCRGIVSFGIAGGLTEHHKPGACVVARAVVHDGRRYDTHLEWSSRLLQTIEGAVHADLAGVSAPVSTAADKIALGRTTGAAAVDMESAICARAAHTHGLPFAVVRVVADPHDRELPPAARIGLLPDGRPDMPKVMRSVLGQPRQIAALVRVGLDTRTARASLLRARRAIGMSFGLADAAPQHTAARSTAPTTD